MDILEVQEVDFFTVQVITFWNHLFHELKVQCLMLDFFLKNESDKFVGHISLEDAKWLSKMGIAKESQLSFDDFEISVKEIEESFNHCLKLRKQFEQVPGFESVALNNYMKILEAAREAACCLSAICD